MSDDPAVPPEGWELTAVGTVLVVTVPIACCLSSY